MRDLVEAAIESFFGMDQSLYDYAVVAAKMTTVDELCEQRGYDRAKFEEHWKKAKSLLEPTSINNFEAETTGKAPFFEPPSCYDIFSRQHSRIDQNYIYF